MCILAFQSLSLCPSVSFYTREPQEGTRGRAEGPELLAETATLINIMTTVKALKDVRI